MCLRGWRASVDGVGDVGGVLAWVAYQRGCHGWLPCVDGVGGVLTWVACCFYCYCYY